MDIFTYVVKIVMFAQKDKNKQKEAGDFSLFEKIHMVPVRHSFVDLSAPTILRPRVRIPSTSTLFQFVYELWSEKYENKSALLKHNILLLH